MRLLRWRLEQGESPWLFLEAWHCPGGSHRSDIFLGAMGTLSALREVVFATGASRLAPDTWDVVVGCFFRLLGEFSPGSSPAVARQQGVLQALAQMTQGAEALAGDLVTLEGEGLLELPPAMRQSLVRRALDRHGPQMPWGGGLFGASPEGANDS